MNTIKTRIKIFRTVREIPAHYVFINGQFDVKTLNNNYKVDFQSFFAELCKDGEFRDDSGNLYGLNNLVPFFSEKVYKINTKH
jgi:hypothetical protein